MGFHPVSFVARWKKNREHWPMVDSYLTPSLYKISLSCTTSSSHRAYNLPFHFLASSSLSIIFTFLCPDPSKPRKCRLEKPAGLPSFVHSACMKEWVKLWFFPVSWLSWYWFIKNKLHGLILLQKAVLKLDLHDEKTKKKAMKRVSSIPGIHFFVLSIIACKSRSSMKYLWIYFFLKKN